MVTPGYQKIHGAGPATTTVAGHTILTTAGYGYRVMNGHLHGLAGAMAVAMPDGLPLHRDMV